MFVPTYQNARSHNTEDIIFIDTAVRISNLAYLAATFHHSQNTSLSKNIKASPAHIHDNALNVAVWQI
jgi:hypothetical protein